jgi:predicted DNA-binding WGR domain protein
MSRTALHKPAAELTRIAPEANQARFYRLALWPDLFGGCALVREWGRIGQPGRLRRDLYDSEARAAEALERIERAKTRRGYRAAS